MSRSTIGMSSSRSTTRESSAGLGTVNRASFMYWEYVEPSPPTVRRNGNTSSATVSNISAGPTSLKFFHRRLSVNPVKITRSTGRPVRFALFSASVWSSSRRRMNNR